ncbi:MAG TPA: DNA polymerase III subunit beta, partial [Streptosporangiaceae bacterium]|nr:DNA polymerase III subunit beta [Streptosporangiaceae bacterium]
VEREALGEAVAWVARALPARPVIPVLSGLLVEAARAGLTLSCFDYEVSARVAIAAEVAEPGSALVPGRLLAEITRSLPERDVEVRSAADLVSLSCGSAEFELVSLPVEEYPGLPEPPPAAGIVDGGVLAAAAAQVVPSASRDDTLPMLTGVCVDIDGTAMTLAATDRYRLAVRTVDWTPAVAGLRAAALVPARTLADVARTMDAGIPVTIAFTTPAEDAGPRPAEPHPAGGMISFEGGGRRLTARLIGADFIRYRSRFPAEFGCRAELQAEPFMAAVRRVSLVADRASPVRLTFGGGEVAIEAHTDGRARAAESVPSSFTGAESVISFNPHYLLDGLAAAAICGAAVRTPPGAGRRADGEDGAAAAAQPAAAPPEPGRIRLEFTSPAKPALITWAGYDADLAGAADPEAADTGAADPEAAETGVAGQDAGGTPASQDGAGATGLSEAGTGATGVSEAGVSEAGASQDGAAEGAASEPAFRYLVVPLRSPAGTGVTRG